jgi:response regulator of citrate/malate metabolism
MNKRHQEKVEIMIQEIKGKDYITIEDLSKRISLKRNSLYLYFDALKKKGIIFSRISMRRKGRPMTALSIKPIDDKNVAVISTSRRSGNKW